MKITNNGLCVIDLPGEKNYAVVSPGRIAYGLNASSKDLFELCAKEKRLLNRVRKHGHNTIIRSSSVGIMPTFDCNLRCVYCYARGGDSKEFISRDNYQIAISQAWKFGGSKNHLDLYLVGGGEPLLDLVLVSEMVNFAKSCYKSVNLRVVTNGVFDEKTLKWICDNKADVRVSYDGVMHDKQRPFPDGSSSRNIVRMNIKELATIGLNPTVQCIVSNEGVNTICQTIDDVLNLRVKRIKIEPVLSTAVSRSGKAMEPNPVEYADRLLKAVEYVASLKIEFKIDTGYFTEPSTGFYCGISDPNKTVTPEGLITACVEVSRQNDPYAETVIYGKIINGNICFDSNKRNLLRSLHFNNQQGGCIDCNLRLICQGGCPMANIWRSGFPYKKSGFTCAVEKFLIPKLLLGIAENPEIGKVVLDTGAKMC